jgi:hypothetical protein
MNHRPQAKPRRSILFADLPGPVHNSTKATQLSSMLLFTPKRDTSLVGKNQGSSRTLFLGNLSLPMHMEHKRSSAYQAAHSLQAKCTSACILYPSCGSLYLGGLSLFLYWSQRRRLFRICVATVRSKFRSKHPSQKGSRISGTEREPAHFCKPCWMSFRKVTVICEVSEPKIFQLWGSASSSLY